jgi:hypothetical protein
MEKTATAHKHTDPQNFKNSNIGILPLNIWLFSSFLISPRQFYHTLAA